MVDKNSNSQIKILFIVALVIFGGVITTFIILNCDSSKEESIEGKTKTVMVNGSSMNPTLKDGEMLSYKITDEINRFDIIVYKDENNNTLIKRVFGLPNEKIVMKNGAIEINDNTIEDKYAFGNLVGDCDILLKNDEYYVLGDYREISVDSRLKGPIKKEKILGVVIEVKENDKEQNNEAEEIEDNNTIDDSNKELVSDHRNLEYEIVNSNSNYNTEVLLSTTNVVLRGKKETIDKVKIVKVIIDLNKIKKDISVGTYNVENLQVQAYDKDNNVVKDIEIIKNTVDAYITIEEKE